jgi:polyphosphate kinase
VSERLASASHFVNREISWLEFNTRVLHEARRRENPLAERLRFVGIVSSNLDEFFMVRVGGLKQLVRQGVQRRCPAGMTPREQLDEVARRTAALVARQYELLTAEILPALAREGVEIGVAPRRLDRAGAAQAERIFEDELFPTLTPVAVEGPAELSRIPGLVLHLALRLRAGARGPERLALLPMPRSMPRAVALRSPRGQRFVLVEDLVRQHAQSLFSGHRVLEAAAFRITRDADLAADDEDVVDLMEEMEGVLRARKEGPPIRLEVEARASAALVARLLDLFPLEPTDVFRVKGPVDLKPLVRVAGQIEARRLHYEPFHARPAPLFGAGEDFGKVVARGDILLHHPYDSFEAVVDLLNQAADDPQVTAIKQTLYRTSEDSPIIAALERAAVKGKQVAVVVELRARFDEAQNIDWARRLSDAGAQVVYGVMGLKTHAKALLIVRREAGGVRRIVHLATGNYNDVTAAMYEDLGLITCDPDMGADTAHFFNAITGYSEARQWRRLAVAPTTLRARLEELIDREIARTSAEAPGLIELKMNSLVDTRLITHLYRASQAGVRVRLCVRGICCLRPGIPGLSENIEVRSIVDRFLEHSRIFHFHNGGDDEVYLSSADWMPRNLDRRVELMFPVLDDALRRRVLGILQSAFADNQRSWRMQPDGSYLRVSRRRGEPRWRTQEEHLRAAYGRAEESARRRLTVFRPLGPGTAPAARR